MCSRPWAPLTRTLGAGLAGPPHAEGLCGHFSGAQRMPPPTQALSRGRRANPVTSCLRLGSGQLPQRQHSGKGNCTPRRERGKWGGHGGWRPGDSVLSPWGRLGQGTKRCSQSRCHELEGPALGMGVLRASPRCQMGSGPYAHTGARGLAGWGVRQRRLGHNLNEPVRAGG